MNGQFCLRPVSAYNPGEILMLADLEDESPDAYCRTTDHMVEIIPYQKFLEMPGLKERHAQLFTQCFQGKNAADDYRRTTCPPWPSLVAAALELETQTWVAFAQANIVSNAIYTIENVMVDPAPEYRGQGYSRAVMEKLMRHLVGLAKWVLLTCASEHELMYRKYGFRKVKKIKRRKAKKS